MFSNNSEILRSCTESPESPEHECYTQLEQVFF